MPKTKAEPAPSQVLKLDTRGQLSVQLGGADYMLRPSNEAIMQCELETGLALFDLATLASNSRMTLQQMGIVTAAMMRAHGKANPEDPLKTDYLGANADRLSMLIYEAGPTRVMGGLALILAGAISGGYTASGEAKAATGTS